MVLISHSPRIAEGTAELVHHMTGELEIVAVGGDTNGALGTDPERIQSAIESLDTDEVLIFMDLGSEVLSAETVLQMLEAKVARKVWLVDAPFVEGAFAAGVLASTGAGAEECVEAAAEARTERKLHG